MGFLLLSTDLGLLREQRRGPSPTQQGVSCGCNCVQRFYGMMWGVCCKQELGLPPAWALSGQAQL